MKSMQQLAGTTETSIKYQTKQRHISVDGDLHQWFSRC